MSSHVAKLALLSGVFWVVLGIFLLTMGGKRR
jgi:hypothetical protein